MKSHLINITYDFNHDENGYEYKYPRYIFTGLVTGMMVNNKLIIDPVKLFEKAFNRKFIGQATITYG